MIELKVLSEQEVHAIHLATLRVLSETGVLLSHAAGRELLLAAGADQQANRILLPPELVENLIGMAGKKITLRGRSGKPCSLGDGSLHWHNLGGARDVFEPLTGARRPALTFDVQNSTRLLDALPGVTTVTPFFTPQDVPGAAMSLAMYRHALPNTTKPLHGPGVQAAWEVDAAVRMAEVVGVPQEILSLAVSPISPLTFIDDAVEAIMAIARRGLIFTPLPCPTAGSTAPLSLAGALVQQNAEILASIVLAQLVSPGLPIVYCGRLAMMEPRLGSSVWGGVELGLVSAATVQIGHYYGFPVNVYGFSTNSHTLDFQNGSERMLNAVIPALAGADELSGVGEMEAGVMGSYAQMVLDNELAQSVRRLLRGFSVDDDSLAVEVIADVLRGSHNFLGQRHTGRYLRGGELLVTHLAERASWDAWDQAGRQEMAARAQTEAEHILATHQVQPLDEYQEHALDEILTAIARL